MPADHHAQDLRCALADRQQALVAIDPLDWEFLAVAIAAKDLDRVAAGLFGLGELADCTRAPIGIYAFPPQSRVLLALTDYAPRGEDATVRSRATDVSMSFKGTWPCGLDG